MFQVHSKTITVSVGLDTSPKHIKKGSSMKTIALALLAILSVPAFATTIQLQDKVIKGYDAEIMKDTMERAGVNEQSAIESSFFQAAEAFCVKPVNAHVQPALTACQYSIDNGGLFVAAEFEDTAPFIKVLRKNGVQARIEGNERRWQLFNLECSTRFNIRTRKLETTCTFQHV